LIIGCGIDLVEINRIERIIKKWEDKFILRLFTLREKIYCESKNNRYQSYAGKFAAKEALLKALGLGLRGIKWKEMEILNDLAGRPVIRTRGKLKTIISQKNISNCLVSISHTQDYVIAEVILEVF